MAGVAVRLTQMPVEVGVVNTTWGAELVTDDPLATVYVGLSAGAVAAALANEAAPADVVPAWRLTVDLPVRVPGEVLNHPQPLFAAAVSGTPWLTGQVW